MASFSSLSLTSHLRNLEIRWYVIVYVVNLLSIVSQILKLSVFSSLLYMKMVLVKLTPRFSVKKRTRNR